MDSEYKTQYRVNMGNDSDIEIRRVVCNDGRIALELVSEGYLGLHPSSTNAIYITTLSGPQVGSRGLPFAPHADSQDIEV